MLHATVNLYVRVSMMKHDKYVWLLQIETLLMAVQQLMSIKEGEGVKLSNICHS